MNLKPNNRQCELVRVMTKSDVSNEQIIKDLEHTSQEEWNQMCLILDRSLKRHNMSFDKGQNFLVEDIISVSTANGVNEASLFIAFMNWIQK